MLKWLVSRIRRIVGEIVMRATYWTGIGVLLIPIGVVLIVEFPNLHQLAFWLIIGGFVSFVAGWGYVIRDERLNRAKEEEAKQQRQLDEKRKQEEHVRYLAMLSIITKRLGANSVTTRRQIEREVERFREEYKEDAM